MHTTTQAVGPGALQSAADLVALLAVAMVGLAVLGAVGASVWIAYTYISGMVARRSHQWRYRR